MILYRGSFIISQFKSLLKLSQCAYRNQTIKQTKNEKKSISLDQLILENYYLLMKYSNVNF